MCFLFPSYEGVVPKRFPVHCSFFVCIIGSYVDRPIQVCDLKCREIRAGIIKELLYV